MYSKTLIFLIIICYASISPMTSQQLPHAALDNIEDNSTDALTRNYIQTYPNPTNGPVILEFKDIQEQLTLEIRSIEGRLLVRQEYNNTATIKTQIDADKGTYFLRISNNSGYVATYKVIKE